MSRIDLESITYDEWKADRQKALDARPPLQRLKDAKWQSMNTNDEFYFGLGREIEQREASKIPIAGEGAVEFLSLAGSTARFIALRTGFFPAALLAKGIGAAEVFVRRRAEL